MTILQAAILGVFQGLTEFLPVSGSGHLVLFQHWFDLNSDIMTFDIVAHWGTLLAVIIYFHSDLQKMFYQTGLFLIRRPKGLEQEAFLNTYPYALTSGLIVLSSLVTIFVGVFFRELFEFTFRSVFAVGIAWVIMGTLLVFANRIKSLDPERDLTGMNHRDAFFIGLAQGLALIPGISGSGAMILMGRRCGLARRDAVRYALILGMPLVLGAGVFKLREGLPFLIEQPQVYGTGFVCAMVVGLLSIRILFQVLERGKLHFFGYYCFAVGVFALASQFLKS